MCLRWATVLREGYNSIMIKLRQSLIALALLPIISANFIKCQERSLSDMNQIAERYVKLVLALGQHDENYVDAYYGPEAWQATAKAEKVPLDKIKDDATSLIEQLKKLNLSKTKRLYSSDNNT